MTITFEPSNELLEPAVRSLVGRDDVQVLNFDIHPLKPGAGNMTSLGVYRVSGQLESAGEQQSFSVVVKHLANGLPALDCSEPTYWNYWRREIEFFESPLVGLIPENIGYPRYLGHSELADGSALFWNGDLGDLEKSEWTWEQCLTAAQLVAQLNSVNRDGLDAYSWLNRTQVEGWQEIGIPFFDTVHKAVMAAGRTDPMTADAMNVMDPFIRNREFIGEIMHAGRQSFVHGDFNLHNLVPVTGGVVDVIALDWQLCGVARVGSEVASIFNTAHETNVIKANVALFNELCTTYADTFNRLNVDEPISVDDVRLAAAATGVFILALLGYYWARPAEGASEAEAFEKVKAHAKQLAAGPMLVYCQVLGELTLASASDSF